MVGVSESARGEILWFLTRQFPLRKDARLDILAKRTFCLFFFVVLGEGNDQTEENIKRISPRLLIPGGK